MPIKDLTGSRFGRLTVLAFSHTDRLNYWLCLCDCGNETTLPYGHLNSGNTKSCGCLKRERDRTWALKHGYSNRRGGNDRTYRCWRNMLSRCRNPRNTGFKNYGGRGITVCERWLKFENFLADLGESPPGLTIERVNNDLGYFPGNCRYVTRLEQARNKRRQGLEKLTAANVRAIRTDPRIQRIIAAAYGVNQTTISAIKRGKRYRNI